jgi:hypothetical protein
MIAVNLIEWGFFNALSWPFSWRRVWGMWFMVFGFKHVLDYLMK